MRLQRIVSRKVGETTYYKWQVTLPDETIQALGWTPGEELQVGRKGTELTIRRTASEPK